MSAIIQLNGLSAAGKLADITLDVAAGEVVALAGSRGSGKTTLIRILAGQMAPTSGTATIGGVDCRTEACRRLVGVAGEAWGLYERLTVLENLLVVARLWGAPGPSIADVLKRLELNGMEQRRADKLQAGEAARLRLARALLHEPAALLLDEPMGDIDRESASIIAFAIGEEAERGKAILMTTFGYRDSLACATRVVYLEGGRLAEPPAPAAFLNAANEPATSIADVVAGLGRPVLVLHGEMDGYVPVTDGEAVTQAAPDRVTLRRYPDLGHALSLTENPAEDTFRVMDPRPIADLIAWIKAH